MTDEDILARLKVIDERLRRISAEDAASVLAGGLAGFREEDRLSLIAETERILDELDGNRVDPARAKKESAHSKAESFTAFRSAFEEVNTKRFEQELVKEGGHMSSTSGRVRHAPDAELPYVALLEHEGSGCTEQSFATMREAEEFIKRNTPKPRRALSTLYDRPPSDS